MVKVNYQYEKRKKELDKKRKKEEKLKLKQERKNHPPGTEGVEAETEPTEQVNVEETVAAEEK